MFPWPILLAFLSLLVWRGIVSGILGLIPIVSLSWHLLLSFSFDFYGLVPLTSLFATVLYSLLALLLLFFIFFHSSEYLN